MRYVHLVPVLALLLALPGGPARAARADLEANKRTVVAFYTKLFIDRDFEAARPYFGDRYIQHNPNVPDGPEALHKYIDLLRDKFPNARSEIKRVFADGDYVILHVHAIRDPGEAGNAIVDIFRLEEGKIVEHWDVVQKVPENAANANTMF